MSRSYVSIAAEAFRTQLRDLGIAEDHTRVEEAVELGRRAALLAAAEALWRDHLGPLLDLKQAQRMLGVGTRQALSDLVRRRRLLRLTKRDGENLFPAFQFDRSGRPFPVLPRVLQAFEGAVSSPWAIASWLSAPEPALDGRTPVEWMRGRGDEDRLVQAAERYADRLAQ